MAREERTGSVLISKEEPGTGAGIPAAAFRRLEMAAASVCFFATTFLLGVLGRAFLASRVAVSPASLLRPPLAGLSGGGAALELSSPSCKEVKYSLLHFLI